MALITCSECGKEISDNAKQCPHCGCGTRFGKEAAQANGLAVASIVNSVVGFIGACWFCFNLVPISNGVDYYGSWGKWLSKDDEAAGIFFKVFVGLGLAIGSVIVSKRLKRKAEWQAQQAAVTHPTIPVCNDPSTRIPDELYENVKDNDSFSLKREQSVPSGWRCICGRINANYVSTCVCGKNKRDL